MMYHFFTDDGTKDFLNLVVTDNLVHARRIEKQLILKGLTRVRSVCDMKTDTYTMKRRTESHITFAYPRSLLRDGMPTT